MSIEWLEEPPVKLGQAVFYVEFEDNCPAALKQRWAATKVIGYQAVVATWDDGDPKLLCTGFKVESLIFNREPDVCLKCGEPHRGNPYPLDVLKPYQVYITQAEVENAVRWYPIELTAQEWMNLHGSRTDPRDLEYEKEYFNEEVIKRRDLEEKIAPLERELAVMRHPWYNYNSFNEGVEQVPIEEAELGPCCANVSNVRDLLMKANVYGGLIRRDVEQVFSNLYGCSEVTWFHPSEKGGYPTPAWDKVLAQLPAEEILALLKEEEEDGD